VGRQNLIVGPDHHNTDLLLAIGWNGMMSHQMPQARRFLTRLSKDPGRQLVVIDPRLSETAKIADIHLPIRPGTDALLTRAMIAIILQEGWQDRAYIRHHTNGFDRILPLFADFDVRKAVSVCELDYQQVRDLCQTLASRNWSMHYDLGVMMNRHSTATTYLHALLLGICGRICVPGGNVIPAGLMPIASHSDERDERTWRTATTGFPAIAGVFPPNVVPEEITSDHPERLRAMIVGQSNPLRSYADTAAYEAAFRELHLLVTAELAMTETAAVSDYVLPARSAYESWDGTFFPWTYPEIFFQMRRPIVEPEGEPLEVGEIYTEIAKRLGLVPKIPDRLCEAAGGPRAAFAEALLKFAGTDSGTMAAAPFVLAETLGKELKSAHLAALWGLLMTAPESFQENAARAGFSRTPLMGEDIFKAILDRPQGLWIGRLDSKKPMDRIGTTDGRVQLFIPELSDWVDRIDADQEYRALMGTGEYPYILMAGLHVDTNANTLMRNPEWNKERRACTAIMHPTDAEKNGLVDGQAVTVATEAGEIEIELEINNQTRPGLITIPHGFGLSYEGQTYGANVNRLTKNTHRDELAGTPLHRFVPCRIEPVS
jgi:anaerobic selenocysteine-containing dehydrogenase